MALVRSGDRFRVTRDVESHVGLTLYAPAHSFGVRCLVSAGTVIVAMDQVEGASAFHCYPEDYDRMERVLIPEEERESFDYAGYYYLGFPVDEIGHLLEPLDALDPRPPNRLPRVTGRPSSIQRREQTRREALRARIDSLEFGSIARVTERSWVRRNPGQRGVYEVLGPDGALVPMETCDIWFDRPPGNPPRPPDVTQPGSGRGTVGRIRDHDLRRDVGPPARQ